MGRVAAVMAGKQKVSCSTWGPSWYLMPEVFESFFQKLGKKRQDYYGLSKLPTYYQVFFGDGTKVKINDNLEETKQVFESLEPGGAAKLERYLGAAKYKYDTAIGEFLYRDYTSVFDFFNKKLVIEGLKLDVFTSLDKFVRREFQDVRARRCLNTRWYSSVPVRQTHLPCIHSCHTWILTLACGFLKEAWFP